MRSLAAVLFALVLLSLPSRAEDQHFTTGEQLTHSVAVCLDLADAKAIVNAHRDSGIEAAKKLWEEADKCRNLPVAGGPRVGRVVHSVTAKVDDAAVTLRVVEILRPDGEQALAYFITILDV